MLENIIFLLTLSYKEQKRLNRGMARVLLVLIKSLVPHYLTLCCQFCDRGHTIYLLCDTGATYCKCRTLLLFCS